MNEQDEFLKEFEPQNTDLFNENLIDEKPVEKTDMEIEPKNRRERRLSERLRKERESNIDLAARLETISNAKQATEESDFLKMIEPIYGNDTPEKAQATELLKNALKSLHDSAVKEASDKYQEISQGEAKAIAAEEDNIETMIEDIEDEYNVSLSKNDRNGFLTLLEKLSPKDKEGNIIEFADPMTTYELYSSRKVKSANKAKELANRSMVSGGSQAVQSAERSAMERYLKENGII